MEEEEVGRLRFLLFILFMKRMLDSSLELSKEAEEEEEEETREEEEGTNFTFP